VGAPGACCWAPGRPPQFHPLRIAHADLLLTPDLLTRCTKAGILKQRSLKKGKSLAHSSCAALAVPAVDCGSGSFCHRLLWRLGCLPAARLAAINGRCYPAARDPAQKPETGIRFAGLGRDTVLDLAFSANGPGKLLVSAAQSRSMGQVLTEGRRESRGRVWWFPALRLREGRGKRKVIIPKLLPLKSRRPGSAALSSGG